MGEWKKSQVNDVSKLILGATIQYQHVKMHIISYL